MNERIRQLAEQAGFNLHNDPIDGHDNTHEIKKFAELIVRECAEICLEANDHKNILKHFEVKE